MVAREQNTLFDEILEFLASNPTPEQIIAFHPSDALQERVSLLLDKQRDVKLSIEEAKELDDFAQANHFMSMLKIRARKKLAT